MTLHSQFLFYSLLHTPSHLQTNSVQSNSVFYSWNNCHKNKMKKLQQSEINAITYTFLCIVFFTPFFHIFVRWMAINWSIAWIFLIWFYVRIWIHIYVSTINFSHLCWHFFCQCQKTCQTNTFNLGVGHLIILPTFSLESN